jgi:hypothetical protein
MIVGRPPCWVMRRLPMRPYESSEDEVFVNPVDVVSICSAGTPLRSMIGSRKP